MKINKYWDYLNYVDDINNKKEIVERFSARVTIVKVWEIVYRLNELKTRDIYTDNLYSLGYLTRIWGIYYGETVSFKNLRFHQRKL